MFLPARPLEVARAHQLRPWNGWQLEVLRPRSIRTKLSWQRRWQRQGPHAGTSLTPPKNAAEMSKSPPGLMY